MSQNQPLISIITVCKNSVSTISETIDSIAAQTWRNLEYIVVDGASTDGTFELASARKAELENRGIRCIFSSESDRGIADAWNKGLAKSSGAVIGYISADDYFAPDTVEKAAASLQGKTCAIAYGICLRVDSEKKIIGRIYRKYSRLRRCFSLGFSNTTSIIQRSVFDRIGSYNENFKIALDIDFLLRADNAKVEFVQSNHITYMREGGVSTANLKKARKEYCRALILNGEPRLKVLITESIVTIMAVIKQIRQAV